MSRYAKIVSLVVLFVIVALLVSAVMPAQCEAGKCQQGGRRWFTTGKSGYVNLYKANGSWAGFQITGGIYQPGTGRIYKKNCLSDPARYIHCGNGRLGTAICN